MNGVVSARHCKLYTFFTPYFKSSLYLPIFSNTSFPRKALYCVLLLIMPCNHKTCLSAHLNIYYVGHQALSMSIYRQNYITVKRSLSNIIQYCYNNNISIKAFSKYNTRAELVLKHMYIIKKSDIYIDIEMYRSRYR